MDRRIVWFIDENDSERRTYSRTLTKILEGSVDVKGISPFPIKEDYLALLNGPNTSCIIIDQKLKTTGIATYTGIELAQYLRSINKKIPIYILTGFSEEEDEFQAGEWSVEEIIAKGDLIDARRAEIIAARILRHIDVYEDILAEREKRFNELLRKSLNDELGEEELRELEALQLERTADILAGEMNQLRKLEQVVEEHKRLLNRFNQLPKLHLPVDVDH